MGEEKTSMVSQEDLPPASPAVASDMLFKLIAETNKRLAEIRDAILEGNKIKQQQTSYRPPTGATTLDAPKPKRSKLETVKATFPKDLEEMLNFEEAEDKVYIRPRQFLGSENFAKIAAIVRDQGGEYISAGKDSHFIVSKNK